jgi:hypothetical protein
MLRLLALLGAVVVVRTQGLERASPELVDVSSMRFLVIAYGSDRPAHHAERKGT